MKNLFKILCGLSIVGLATVACSKEVEQDVAPETPAVSKHSVKVTAGLSAETKTVMLSSGDQTKWTDDDTANMHFFENGTAPEASDLTVELNSEKTELTITADFANTSATKYVYTSILASNLDSEKNAILDDEQYLFNDTFDPLADILVAYPEEFNASQSLAEFTMQYKRVVAVNKIKIKGLAEGDKISSVTISSNKPILGSYSMTNDAWTNSGNELLLSAYDDIVVPASGEVSLWFITAPVSDATLSIYVETDNHKYEKDFTKTISFAANTVTAFATTVAESEVVVNPASNNYVKVTSTSDVTPGKYLIVYEDGEVAFKGSLATLDAASNTFGVTFDANGEIEASTETAASYFELAKYDGGFSIKSASGKYIGQSSNANGLIASDAEVKNTISIDDDENADIVSAGGAYLRYNATSGQERFRYFKSSTYSAQKAIQLYKLDEGGATKSPLAKPVITLSRTENLKGIVVAWTDVTKAANYTVACTGQTSQIIAQGVQTATFANLEPGIYTVTVTANPANTDRNTATTSDEGSIEILNYQLTAPSITFNNTTESIVASWNIEDYEAEKAESYSYKILDGETVVVAEKTVTTGSFEETGLTPNHNYTVQFKVNGKAPYVGTEYANHSTKTLKPALTTIAEIKAELADGASSYEANLTDAIVTGKYTNGSNTYQYIEDATAGICVFGNVDRLTVGKKFSGKISGTMTTYRGMPEIQSITFDSGVTEQDGVELPLTEVSLADLVANMSTYDGMRVKISKVKTASNFGASNTSNVDVSYGGNTINVRQRVARTGSIAANTYIDVIGFPNIYSYNSTTKNQIDVAEASAVTETSITWQVKSIAIAHAPNKVAYTVGDNFDPTGLIISTVVEDAVDASIYKNGENVAYSGNESDFSFDPALDAALAKTDESVEITYGGKSTAQAITVSNPGESPEYATKTIDFESALDTYTDWSFTNIGIRDEIGAKEGSSYGANANTSGNAVQTAAIATKATFAKPYSIEFSISKESKNTTASSWIVQVSTNGTDWTDVETIDAKDMTKEVWVDKSVVLSAHTGVYVRIYYTGTNAYRCIDSIVLTYQTN